MALTHKLTITDSNRKQHNANAALPNECPICHTKIQPYVIESCAPINKYEAQIVLRCNSDECENYFIAYYSYEEEAEEVVEVSTRYVINLPYKKLKPVLVKEREFSDNINEISPDFISIYHEALEAENMGLEQITGVGYRKALEFLIKDYAKSTIDENEHKKIEKQSASQVIQNYIEDKRIKDMASRALWLGNDETHYLRKWIDKDITDLKRLIDLTIHWIEIEKETQQYKEDMQ